MTQILWMYLVVTPFIYGDGTPGYSARTEYFYSEHECEIRLFGEKNKGEHIFRTCQQVIVKFHKDVIQ